MVQPNLRSQLSITYITTCARLINNENIAFGNISTVLEETPKYVVVLVLFLFETFLYGFFAPIWAILKTHLYFEQTGDVAENALIQ